MFTLFQFGCVSASRVFEVNTPVLDFILASSPHKKRLVKMVDNVVLRRPWFLLFNSISNVILLKFLEVTNLVTIARKVVLGTEKSDGSLLVDVISQSSDCVVFSRGSILLTVMNSIFVASTFVLLFERQHPGCLVKYTVIQVFSANIILSIVSPKFSVQLLNLLQGATLPTGSSSKSLHFVSLFILILGECGRHLELSSFHIKIIYFI